MFWIFAHRLSLSPWITLSYRRGSGALLLDSEGEQRNIPVLCYTGIAPKRFENRWKAAMKRIGSFYLVQTFIHLTGLLWLAIETGDFVHKFLSRLHSQSIDGLSFWMVWFLLWVSAIQGLALLEILLLGQDLKSWNCTSPAHNPSYQRGC